MKKIIFVIIHLIVFNHFARAQTATTQAKISHKDVVVASKKRCDSTQKLSSLSEQDLKNWGFKKAPIMSVLDKVGVIDLSSLPIDDRVFTPKGTDGSCKNFSLGGDVRCSLCNENADIFRMLVGSSVNNFNKYRYEILVPPGYDECEKKFRTRAKSCETIREIVDKPRTELNEYDPREFQQEGVTLFADYNNNGIDDVSRGGQFCLLSGFDNEAQQAACREKMKSVPIRIPSVRLSLHCPISSTPVEKSDFLKSNSFEVCAPYIREGALETNHELGTL